MHKDLDRKPERQRPLERPVCEWKDTMKTDFKEISLEGLDQVSLAQDTAVMGMCEHSNGP
jgi:hypothetical protein